MGNELAGHAAHSAEYFGDTRDAWWNADFVALMATRWRLEEVRDALDVGCGIGHWGQMLARVLPDDCALTGVDREPEWVERATARAAERRRAAQRFHYQVGLAEKLPFPDQSFDLVTCQTVLIHAPDPEAVLAEMIRVTRIGGLVAVAEPNNVASALLGDVGGFYGPIDDLLAMVRFAIVCGRGKAALGLGDNSVGERVPGLFAKAGLGAVDAFLSDRAFAMIPPYASHAERAMAEEITAFAARDFWIWSREETHRYFLAGGGDEAAFAEHWDRARADVRRAAAAIENRTYTTAGGSILYLVSGRRTG